MLGSSVRALIAHANSKMGARGAKQACVHAKKGSRAFQMCVRSSRVLRRLVIVGEP